MGSAFSRDCLWLWKIVYCASIGKSHTGKWCFKQIVIVQPFLQVSSWKQVVCGIRYYAFCGKFDLFFQNTVFDLHLPTYLTIFAQFKYCYCWNSSEDLCENVPSNGIYNSVAVAHLDMYSTVTGKSLILTWLLCNLKDTIVRVCTR